MKSKVAGPVLTALSDPPYPLYSITNVDLLEKYLKIPLWNCNSKLPSSNRISILCDQLTHC